MDQTPIGHRNKMKKHNFLAMSLDGFFAQHVQSGVGLVKGVKQFTLDNQVRQICEDFEMEISQQSWMAHFKRRITPEL